MLRSSEAESRAHREMREALRNVGLSIKGLEVDEFDMQQLRKFNTRIDPMELDEASRYKPSYFAAYPGHLIPDPDDEALGGAYNGIHDETELDLKDPASRAYAVNIYLSRYISHCDRYAKGERVDRKSVV